MIRQGEAVSWVAFALAERRQTDGPHGKTQVEVAELFNVDRLFPGWYPSVGYWSARRDGIQFSTRIVHEDQWVYQHLPNRVSRSPPDDS
jgi:hypothetical protein